MPADTVTYNSLITAAAQSREYDRAQELLAAMGRAGLAADEWTYNALLSVCERCGRWEEALDVFERMKAEQVRPTTVTYNTLISACEKGWQWERAMKVGLSLCECVGVEHSAPALDRRWGPAKALPMERRSGFVGVRKMRRKGR